MKGLVIFLTFRASTGHSSNSTGSCVTRRLVLPVHCLVQCRALSFSFPTLIIPFREGWLIVCVWEISEGDNQFLSVVKLVPLEDLGFQAQNIMLKAFSPLFLF